MIMLNSHRAATDLLDKRSSIYSDRPWFAMFEMYGFAIGSALYPNMIQQDWLDGYALIPSLQRRISSLEENVPAAAGKEGMCRVPRLSVEAIAHSTQESP